MVLPGKYGGRELEGGGESLRAKRGNLRKANPKSEILNNVKEQSAVSG